MRVIRSALLPLVAVAIAFLATWQLCKPAPVATSNPAQVLREAERGGYRLIDIDALNRMYQSGRDQILLVDTRQEWEHRTGHIAGSVNFPMTPTAWARWRSTAAMSVLLGPDKEKTIVFY